MKFTFLNQAAQAGFTRFQDHLQQLPIPPDGTFSKFDQCPYEIFLFAGNNQFIRRMRGKDSNQILSYLKEFLFQSRNVASNAVPFEFLDSYHDRGFTEKIDYPLKSRKPEIIRVSKTGFLVFFSDNEKTGIPFIVLQIISNIWQLDQGGIPLHTAGVLHKGGLYLFSGPSGAGKSTISIYSMNIGDKILDEDQLIISKLTPDGNYSAIAWGKGFLKSDAPVRAYFWIIKSNENQLLPLAPKQVSKRIWEQSLLTIGGVVPRKDRQALFSRVTEFARSIPGYELHFRKSPDFWKLIDAELPPITPQE